MPDTKTKKQITLSLLPTLDIEGQEWEYRARNPEIIRFVQKMQNLKAPSTDNLDEVLAVTDEANAAIRGFMEALFVKGGELYALVNARYGGDIERWLEFIGQIVETIEQTPDPVLDDLKRFKSAQ